MQVDARGVKAAAQGHVQLASGRHVAGQALLREHAIDGGAREGLGREQHVEVVMPGTDRVEEGPGAGAQVLLGHDVGRSPELAREFDHVAAADLQPAARVDAGPPGKDGRGLHGGRHCGADHAMPLRMIRRCGACATPT